MCYYQNNPNKLTRKERLFFSNLHLSDNSVFYSLHSEYYFSIKDSCGNEVEYKAVSDDENKIIYFFEKDNSGRGGLGGIGCYISKLTYKEMIRAYEMPWTQKTIYAHGYTIDYAGYRHIDFWLRGVKNIKREVRRRKLDCNVRAFLA